MSPKPRFTPTDDERDAGVAGVREHAIWDKDDHESLAFKASCPQIDWLVAHTDCYCPWCGLKHFHDVGYLREWSG